MTSEIILTLIGLVAGLFGGMLGVGGSIVMIPALTEFLGPDQHLYQSTAMIVNFFVVVPAVFQHQRARAIDHGMVLRLIPVGLIAVVAGVGLSELPVFSGRGETYLRGLFGLFLLAAAICDLWKFVMPIVRGTRSGNNADGTEPIRDNETMPKRAAHWYQAAIIAGPTGLVAGLLGVGGGILAVPLQQKWLGTPIRRAIANSAALITMTSVVGALVKNLAYLREHGTLRQPIWLATLLIPAAMLGSLIGSRLTYLLPLRWVKLAFWVMLLVVACRLSYGAVFIG